MKIFKKTSAEGWRIALVRAIYKPKEILLLDGFTAFLDAENDEQL